MVKPQGFTMTYVSSDDIMSRLSESNQLVLTSVENHVDGKITTGIEGLRKIGDIRANQRRPRRVDETASTVHGCNEGAGIRHVTNKDALEASRQLIPTSRAS